MREENKKDTQLLRQTVNGLRNRLLSDEGSEGNVFFMSTFTYCGCQWMDEGGSGPRFRQQADFEMPKRWSPWSEPGWRSTCVNVHADAPCMERTDSANPTKQCRASLRRERFNIELVWMWWHAAEARCSALTRCRGHHPSPPINRLPFTEEVRRVEMLTDMKPSCFQVHVFVLLWPQWSKMERWF